MQIPANAETKTLQIQGLPFEAPIVVSEENFDASIAEFCSPEMAAQILQQTFMENWRNNFAKEVIAAETAAAESLGIEFSGKIKDLSDADAQKIFEALNMEELQKKFLVYIDEYEPGVRRTSGTESLSPVEREALNMARNKVRDYLETELGVGRNARAETYKEWDKTIKEKLSMSGKDYIEQMASELVENEPQFREVAQATIEARKAIVSNISLSV